MMNKAELSSKEILDAMKDKVTKQHRDRKATNEGVDKAFEEKYTKRNKDFKGPIPIDNKKIGDVITKIKNEVFKTYLPYLDNEIIYEPMKNEFMPMNYLFRVRIIKITKWVTEKGENSLDKLKNVYSALSRPGCSFAMVADRTVSGTDLYFVLVNRSADRDPAKVDSLFELFTSALKGNFPGVEYAEITDDEVETGEENAEAKKEMLEAIQKGDFEFDYAVKRLVEKWTEEERSVSMVTNVPSEKSENFKSQGIEKLLDGVVPTCENDEYTIVFLAESMESGEIIKKEEEFSEYHTAVNPYISWQRSESLGTVAARTSIQTSTTSGNVGATSSASVGISEILSVSKSLNFNVGYAKTLGVSKSESISENETLTLTNTDYSLEQTKEKIEAQITRFQNGASLGMWKFATYVLSKDYANANNVANMYRSLTQGDDSYVECAATNIWNSGKKGSTDNVKSIIGYLREFRHPNFKKLDNVKNFLPKIANGYTLINGTEIAMAMNMPNAAVSGLPVIECAEFGRDVIAQSADYKPEVNLGSVFHMQREELNKNVCLDSKSLTEHVFVTGSTGAGKSTTIYRLLSEAVNLRDSETNEKRDITFMVIEPAKGEYRKELQKHTDEPITVYGTNPKLDGSNLLKINPFSFPSGKIHILEHLDRLIEIFNVCWPMYAAMPAVLKMGIEEAYKAVGWDLLNSENRISNKLFPTFTDVCNNIRRVIEESDYSAENKGDYKGALVTRLESLTNGINGLIFVSNEISEIDLFDKNTIVDLSRVGSTETKALIMGLLVMKLQEYRMATAESSNAELKHITVLEEAHNLLKRTSTEQSAEGSNLIGKSVEMLSNSIAEMRTYGEAFVIADQAPGLMDMSVIRNTNTKIIMRLPDYSDRELVGRAANLNDDQIIEIAKLKPGVAAVYYNGWINPVLCKVPYSKKEKEALLLNSETDCYRNDYDEKNFISDTVECIIRFAEIDDVDSYLNKLLHSNLSGEFIAKMYDFCDPTITKEEKKKMLPSLWYSLFNPYQTMKKAEKLNETNLIHDHIVNELNIAVATDENRKIEDMIILNLLHEHIIRTHSHPELYTKYSDYVDKKYFMK